MRDFQNSQSSPEKDIYMKQLPSPPFLGIVSNKKWSLFLDLVVRSPYFLYPKSLKMAVSGEKNGTSDAQIQKRRQFLLPAIPTNGGLGTCFM